MIVQVNKQTYPICKVCKLNALHLTLNGESDVLQLVSGLKGKLFTHKNCEI